MKFQLFIAGFVLVMAACKSNSTEPSRPASFAVSDTGFSSGNLPQRVSVVPIPASVSFAGENVPLDRSDVREALENELTVNVFKHSNTIKVLKNIERWRPYVAQTLKDNNIPEDFIYLAVIESEFDCNANSPAGAVGMWQIMEDTGKELNLEQSDDVDMRRDPKLSTIAACKFLQKSYEKLGSWTLTAASYNVGIQGMKNRLEDQKVDNFYDLHLNSETSRYIYRIIAMKLIVENPEKYGYFVPAEHKYVPYKFKTELVSESIDNLVDYAKNHQTTYKQLRLLNPWFNNTKTFSLKVKKDKQYEIRLPE